MYQEVEAVSQPGLGACRLCCLLLSREDEVKSKAFKLSSVFKLIVERDSLPPTHAR